MSLSDFEFGKELGKGAFGSVHIVKRKEDGKTYAMKRVKISQLAQKERENALNEIRLLASLSHNNIIGYKEAFFDEISKTINIVMELANDGDLQSKIKSNIKSRLSFKESTIWSILIQILQGIKYLHDNNIMHRDIKSANLFLMKSGIVKIGDLNVSKIAKMGMASTQTGTPYYASPEVWKDKPYDYKSDIWSIGCITYEMCTLKPPFRGTSFPNLYQNIQKGVYEPIPSLYSCDLSKIISYMLQTNPNSRLSSDQLLKTDIILNKMKETQSVDMNNSEINSRVDFIKTIKIPKNMKEMNRALPNKRYKNREEEMMANDEFETKKADFFKNVNMNMMDAVAKHNLNSEPKGKINHDYNYNKKNNGKIVKNNEANVSGNKNNKNKISIEEKKRIIKGNNYAHKEMKKHNIVSNSNQLQHRPISGKPAVFNNRILSNNNNLHNNNANNNQQKNNNVNMNKIKGNMIIINKSNNNRPISGKVINHQIVIKQLSNKKQIYSEHKVMPKSQPEKMKLSSNNNNNYNKERRPITASKPIHSKKVVIEKISYKSKNKNHNQNNKVHIHPASPGAKQKKVVIQKVPQGKQSSGKK